MEEKLEYLNSVIKLNGNKVVPINENDSSINSQLIVGGVAGVLAYRYGFSLEHYDIASKWVKQQLKQL